MAKDSKEEKMQRFAVAHTVKSAIVLTLATSLIAAPAAAGPVVATAPQLVSGLTPLPAEGQPGWCGSPARMQDWEFDQTLAVDPDNPDRLAVAWTQDAYDGIVVGASTDGGSSWGRTVVSPVCVVPGEVSADDASLSFGPDGVLYLSWRLFESHYASSTLLVNRSLDGGRTWSEPMTVDAAAFPVGIDVTQVVADPTRRGVAYALWGRADLDPTTNCVTAFKHYVSHTEDGGVTWSPPSEVPATVDFSVGQLVVLRDGTLLNVVVELPNAAPCANQGPTRLVARRSTDLGVQWSAPSMIGQEADGQDDVSGQSTAVAPDGTVYVSWETQLPGPAPRPFSVMHSKSSDGGKTWQAPAPVVESLVGPVERAFAVTPTIPSPTLQRPALAVAADGTVAVGFYDRRNATDTGSNRNATDYWLRHSHDGGETWQEDHIAGPLDRTDPRADSFVNGAGFLGCCQGLVAIPGGFAASFALGPPFAAHNSDIFFSRIRMAEADLSLSKTGPAGRVPTGRNMTYTLTIANNGPDDASSVTVTDQLPASVSFISASPSQGTCLESSGTVTCDLGAIATGVVATVEIVVTPTLVGTITNTAAVIALTPDPNQINNTDSVDTSICRITSRRSSIPCG